MSNTRSLLETARGSGAREIVVALEDRRGMPLQPLLEARMEGIAITSYLCFWERETRRVNLMALDPSWLIYADGFHVATATNALLKRALDIIASLMLLVLTLPVLVLAALAIKLDGPGPLLPPGPGRPRRPDLPHLQIPHHAGRRRNRLGPAMGDGRRSARHGVGRFLRRMRIDELPQIVNVLQGDMSFVGPRPERPCFVQSLAADIPFFAERHRVRPGITGWAQINYPYGASIEDARAKLSYDLYYIKNFSFLFDLLIILSTAKAVFLNGGGR